MAVGGPSPFSSLSAYERAGSLLDPGTFHPVESLPVDVPLVVGSGRLAGAPVLLALTDGHLRGGTIGVRESQILARFIDHAAAIGREPPPAAVIIGFDTGGVRVEEGPIALAAASAVGVALARSSLHGVPLAAVISGPRGCFGAPAVMAALPERIIMTEDAHWGITGPKLFGGVLDASSAEAEGFEVTSAENRLRNGDTHVVVADAAEAVRAALHDFVREPAHKPCIGTLEARIASGAAVTALLQRSFRGSYATDRSGPPPARRRDLLQYSFRGQWRPTGPMQRRGLVHAALGVLGERPALSFIIGPERANARGIGIEEAAVITDMLRIATGTPGPQRTAILTFLFCQGHAVDFAQERFGLPRALAECLRAMVAARLRGHAIITVLGGGTYGAAYLALAAPSHRILAMRGTAVAPMSPQVLQAFQSLRGRQVEAAEPQLAEWIPDIRIVESVIRLPRVLREELLHLLDTVRPEVNAA